MITVINVIGTRTAAHAARNLAELGAAYAASPALAELGETNAQVTIEDPASEISDETRKMIEDRLLGAILMPVTELVDEGLATIEQIDLGAQHALKYGRAPGAILQELGDEPARNLVADFKAARGAA